MNGQLILTAERTIVHLAGVGIVLSVAVPNLALFDDAIEQQGFQFFQDVGCFDLCILDLFLDVFFFIGQVLVQIGITLDIGLLLQ